MHVTLTPQLEAMIQRKVESGLYNDASEVVLEALRAMDEHDRHELLRAAVAKGVEQIARGEGVVYTPELRADIRRAALEKERAGARPKADVLP